MLQTNKETKITEQGFFKKEINEYQIDEWKCVLREGERDENMGICMCVCRYMYTLICVSA